MSIFPLAVVVLQIFKMRDGNDLSSPFSERLGFLGVNEFRFFRSIKRELELQQALLRRYFSLDYEKWLKELTVDNKLSVDAWRLFGAMEVVLHAGEFRTTSCFTVDEVKIAGQFLLGDDPQESVAILARKISYHYCMDYRFCFEYISMISAHFLEQNEG